MAAAEEYPVNFSASTVDVISTDIIRIHHITAPWAEGTYWADFKWDPVNLVMVLVDGGLESLPPGVTWTVDNSPYQAVISSNPSERSLTISLKCIGSMCSFDAATGPGCYGSSLSFAQGNNFTFFLTMSSSQVNSATAYVTILSSSGNWDGCGYLFYNQEIEMKISDMPTWFDFTKAFTISDLEFPWPHETWTLNADGSSY